MEKPVCWAETEQDPALPKEPFQAAGLQPVGLHTRKSPSKIQLDVLSKMDVLHTPLPQTPHSIHLHPNLGVCFSAQMEAGVYASRIIRTGKALS